MLKGTLENELRYQTITLGPGEMYVVPKGVEHRPVARDEVRLLLIEPTGTPNTGDTATAAAQKLALSATLRRPSPSSAPWDITLGSGHIDQSQKMATAVTQIAEKKVCAHRS